MSTATEYFTTLNLAWCSQKYCLVKEYVQAQLSILAALQTNMSKSQAPVGAFRRQQASSLEICVSRCFHEDPDSERRHYNTTDATAMDMLGIFELQMEMGQERECKAGTAWGGLEASSICRGAVLISALGMPSPVAETVTIVAVAAFAAAALFLLKRARQRQEEWTPTRRRNAEETGREKRDPYDSQPRRGCSWPRLKSPRDASLKCTVALLK